MKKIDRVPGTGDGFQQVNGVHDADVIQSVGEHFELDDLVMEDIVNTNQRPKAEEFENYLFVLLKALEVDKDNSEVSIEQVSIVLGRNWLISFQESNNDVYDHIIQLIDAVETQRETLNDFLNLYMSGMSNKMNEVMKVLTIFASIFIPLTFIAGIYGMNFDIMPELHWKHGYLLTWGIMIGVAAALLIYFRRKKWL